MSSQLPSRRISFEVPVVEKVEFHHWIASQVSVDAKLGAPDDYHLTVLYLGRTDEVYSAVHSASLGRHAPVDEIQFKHLYANWLKAHVRVLRHSVKVVIGELSTLGSRSPYSVVCKVATLPPELIDLHEKLLDSFAHFLESDLGIADGLGFLRSTDAFGYSGKSWVPHITVGTSRDPVQHPLLARDVELGPMHVRNGSSLGIYE